jgi:hypothetical protein
MVSHEDHDGGRGCQIVFGFTEALSLLCVTNELLSPIQVVYGIRVGKNVRMPVNRFASYGYQKHRQFGTTLVDLLDRFGDEQVRLTIGRIRKSPEPSPVDVQATVLLSEIVGEKVIVIRGSYVVRESELSVQCIEERPWCSVIIFLRLAVPRRRPFRHPYPYLSHITWIFVFLSTRTMATGSIPFSGNRKGDGRAAEEEGCS